MMGTTKRGKNGHIKSMTGLDRSGRYAEMPDPSAPPHLSMTGLARETRTPFD